MPTNDERREVAARLREMAVMSNPSWPALMEALGCPGRSVAVMFLADLIEPEGRTCRMEKESGYFKADVVTWFCSECGSPVYNDATPSYCLYCGAKVVEG